MFIGICGGICAGKNTVAQYLVDHHGFRRLHLDRASSSGSASASASTSSPALTDDTQDTQDHPLVSTPPPPTARGRHPHHFSDASNLLDFVTQHWQSRWVTTDVHSESALDLFHRRPFFILISVDAPVTVRWERYRTRSAALLSAPSPGPPQPRPLATLEDFIADSDAHLYDVHTGLLPLISRASVRLLNTSSSLAHLYATLGNLALSSAERLRPSWDAYFMALASLAAQRSNCMKRRVGAVLVGRGRRVLSTGYNGTPRGMRNCADGGCGRCNNTNNDGAGASASGVGLATCLCIHAEENALLEAGRERIREGSVLYCDTCPCLTCSIKICQVGIGEVVYAQGYSMDSQTAGVFREAGVKLRQFNPPPNGLIHLEKVDSTFVL